MADTDEKAPKGERQAKGGKAGQGDKPKQAQQPKPHAPADKADKGSAKKPEAGEKPKGKRPEQRVTPRLRTHFETVVSKELTEKHGYKNRMQVPRIQKVVINMGIGEGVADRKKVESAAADLTLI